MVNVDDVTENPVVPVTAMPNDGPQVRVDDYIEKVISGVVVEEDVSGVIVELGARLRLAVPHPIPPESTCN